MAFATAGPLHRLWRSPSPAGGGIGLLVLPHRGSEPKASLGGSVQAERTMRSMVEGAS